MKTIGRITKTFGFEGAVVVRSSGTITGEPKQGEPVFIVTDGIPVPFFTREAFLTAPDTLIISFDDYLTAESVTRFRGCEVLTEAGEETEDELKGLAGFILTDSATGITGTIKDVIRNPGQLMAVAVMNDAEVLVPLHHDLIISVNKKRKTIIMTLPGGLIGLNG